MDDPRLDYFDGTQTVRDPEAEYFEKYYEEPSEYDFRAPTLSEQHAQWHQIHGREATCPLDCAPDGWDHHEDDEYDWEVGTAICGHCQRRGVSVEHVRLCPSR